MQSQTLPSYHRTQPVGPQGAGIARMSGAAQSARFSQLNDVLEAAYNQMCERVNQNLPTAKGTSNATHSPAFSAASAEDFSPQAVTDRIMGFINNRLQQEKSNGASEARIQELYNQALKGVESGLRDAKKIIQGAGIFTGEVKTNFETTVNMIADRLQSLGKSLFESEAPAKSSMQVKSQSMSLGQSRNFSMQVVTQDGDRVTLNIASGQFIGQQKDEFSSQGVNASSTTTEYSSYDHFAFQVEGELDEGEMKALQDLFKQVNSVAETFFQGDVESAFNQALEVGMDVNELSAFAVDLNRSETSVVQTTYARIDTMRDGAGSDGPGRQPVRNRLASLGDFTNKVNQARDAVQTLMSNLPNANELFNGLLGSLQSADASQDSRDAFQSWVNRD